jgi:dienelactone hydrolase
MNSGWAIPSDNAYRLQGKLMLILGELDDNVPVESTYRLADALIKAKKDFDFVVVPGAGHGMGGEYGVRRMQDFFVRHLLQKEPPPDRNATNSESIADTPSDKAATTSSSAQSSANPRK